MDADYSKLIGALAKLEKRWRGQGISLADRVEASVVREQIARLGKRVSEDMLTLYSSVGGILDKEMDDACFSLWPLKDAIERNEEIESEYWCFGDHLIDSFLYVSIYQTPQESSVGAVFYPSESPLALSPTLETFFVRFAEASTEEERLSVII